MVEGPQICIPGKDPLEAVTIGPDLQGDGVEVLDGEIAHLEDDHALPMGENEKGIEIETEVEIARETEIGIKIETLTGTEKRTGGEGVTERLKNEEIGFPCQRRRL